MNESTALMAPTQRLSNHDHRLIGPIRMRDQSPAPAIRQQIQLLKNSLTDENLVTQYHGFFQGIAVLTFKNNRFRYADSLRSTSKARNTLMSRLNAQAL